MACPISYRGHKKAEIKRKKTPAVLTT